MNLSRVLVVDDDPVVRMNLVAYLEDEGFVVISAGSGEEGLDLIERCPVDAAVVDMRLPVMDGNTFIRQAHEIRPEMRFLVHTGSIHYQVPDELGAITGQPVTVLRKPLGSLDILGQALRALIGQSPPGDRDNNPAD